MKNVSLLFGLLLLAAVSLAQAPQAFKYQAVARNTSGEPLENQQVAVQVSILNGSPSGEVVYCERHNVTTNPFGLFDLEIGNPDEVISGTFQSISWAENTHFLKLELDENGGTNYQLMGVTQLLSVPYALLSENTVNNDDADADPTNEFQTISKDGQTVTLSNNGGSFADETEDADADPTNELQNLTQNGLEVSLSQGGGTINIADNDNDPANELQQVSRIGNEVTLSQNGGSFIVDDADADPTNELQNLGNTKNDNLVDITITNGTGTTIDVSDSDSDPTNELQTLSQNGLQVTLSQGGGTINVADNDNDPANEIQQISKVGNTVTLSQGGGSFTDANTTYQAGSGLQLTGTTFSNTAPDQTVSITAGTGISKSGTYPNFTIANTAPDQTVSITPGTGITNSGTYPNFTIANSMPDQTVTMQGTGAATVSGTYPNFTLNANPADTSATNELQTITKEGSTVTLSKNGGSFTDDNTTYQPGKGLTLDGTTFNSVWDENNGNISNNNSGNVGIGTNTPSQTLTVNGSFTYAMTQNDVKNLRTLNTIFQNTTGRIMYVSIVSFHSAVGTTQVFCDNNLLPTTLVSGNSGSIGYNRNNFFIVLPNYFYKVTMDSGGSIASWIEWY